MDVTVPLPGTRTYTDDEIASVLAEALDVYERVVAEYERRNGRQPPTLVKQEIFRVSHQMVGTRRMPEVLDGATARKLGLGGL